MLSYRCQSHDPIGHLPPSANANIYYPRNNGQAGEDVKCGSSKTLKKLMSPKVILIALVAMMLIALVLYAAMLGVMVDTRESMVDLRKLMDRLLKETTKNFTRRH